MGGYGGDEDSGIFLALAFYLALDGGLVRPHLRV